MADKHSETIYLKDYKPPAFSIDQVHLYFDIHDDHTMVRSILHMQREHHDASALHLHGEALSLKNIYVDGKALPKKNYTVTDDSLTIQDLPTKFILETIVKIEPQKNTELMGLYQSRDNLCTQCEPEGFRRITYFLDQPDVMTRFTTTITADKTKYPILLSNGNLIEEKALDNNRHWVHWEDPSLKPCYLFALVAGDFDLLQDQFQTKSKRTIDLFLYLEKGFLDQGDYAMTALKKSMRWDEERFGREYDLERFMTVAVSDFNAGAMENKGLNIFNTKYILAKPTTATDQDYMRIEGVIGHEYFHNWSGNRVTLRDWFQLTLKEGLTVFRDQSFTEDMTSKGVARIDVVNALRNQQFPEDASSMAHPIRPDHFVKIDNFYTMTVYEKGAEVIRMVQTLLTPDVFRKAMDLYFEKYDGHAVTTEDFIVAMEKASDKDLSQFSRWYHQAGTPVLKVTTRYDADKKTFAVTVEQRLPVIAHQPEPATLHLPFAMGLVGADCKDLPLQLKEGVTQETIILDITKQKETFTLINVEEKPVPSLLRHFSAPVELQYDYLPEELAYLWQCDSDAFCRWEAGQRFLVNAVAIVAKTIIAGKSLAADPVLLRAIEQLLTREYADKNVLARLLAFPTLKYLLSQIEDIDLEILYQAKIFLENALAEALEAEWLVVFEANQLAGEYKYDMDACGTRALKHICLSYLLKTKKEKYIALAHVAATSANNMTDRLGALNILNDYDVPERNAALSDFYKQYEDEPLVVNKWLSLHANTTLPCAMSELEKCLSHTAFDIQNPNNIYALMITFAQNTLRFHDKGGVGYKWLPAQALKVDGINPQVAARIARPLTQWQQMDDARGQLMKDELMRLRDNPKLSDNLKEVVGQGLAG